MVGLLALGAACTGDDGAPGAPGEPAPTPATRETQLPGFNLLILSVTGGSGPGGNFRAGDRLVVRFTATEGEQGSDEPGDPIPIEDWAFAEALFSGPVNNFQSILRTSTATVKANTVRNGDGSWTFTWPDPIPAIVPDQINQQNTIPYDSGTLAGQPLPDGTYRLAMSMRQDITILGTTFRDATSTTLDFLFGTATQFTRREMVTNENCQNCHRTLRAHGENRYGVKVCVMCHANGAEDLNDPNAAAGATLGLSISFQTMIHKIHSGQHLPSVNGKTVDANGNPVYGQGTPYVIVRSRGEFDFSHVGFPQWPHLSQGMPRDLGYDALALGNPSAAAAERAILSGPTNCLACHGDPDGAGPLPAPADGDTIFSNAIVTRACVACHDDWDPSKPYRANGSVMPANLPDNLCTECHGESPTNPQSTINVRQAHTHPLLDNGTPPVWGPGAGARDLQFNVTAVDDGAGGRVDIGDKVQVTVDIVDGQGGPVAAADILRMEVVVTGPVQNPNLLYVGNLPPAAILGTGPTHQFLLPERIDLEIAAPGTAANEFLTVGDHRQAVAATQVWTVPSGGTGTTATSAVRPHQNYIDVVSAAGIATNDVIVIDESTADREYLRVRGVVGNRIWFAAPIDVPGIALRKAHAAGASVFEVTPAPQAGFAVAGNVVTLAVAPAPTARVLVSYTTDFTVPALYRGAINNSPSTDPTALVLEDNIGDWAGLSVVSGTYNIGVYGEVGFTVTVSSGGQSQNTAYTEGSQGSTVIGFRLGSDGPIETNPRISSGTNCYTCHRDLQFHGAHRRGIQNCLLCHGSAGAEDWPIFKLGNPANDTPGVPIEYRNMLHKIHHGRNLSAGAAYRVLGFNGSVNTFEEIGFPSFQGETANCEVCHGEGNTAWHAPTERLHPDAPLFSTQSNWRLVCGSCHDSRTVAGHIEANTGNGLESCLICHGAGKELSVESVHKFFVR